MSSRQVPQQGKYTKTHSKVHQNTKKKATTLPKVRLMAPFTFQCDSPECKKTIYKSTKFNARKQLTNETYLGIKIVKFTIRCPACGRPIEFQTDPQTSDYKLTSGANLLVSKLEETPEEKLKRLETKEEVDPLQELETKAAANKSEADKDREILELYKQASSAAKFVPRSVRNKRP